MKILLFNDLHNEFGKFIIPPMPDDKDTILVLAGDVDAGNRTIELSEYLIECSLKFRHVIFVPGNHEFYHGIIGLTIEEVIYNCSNQKNIHVLDNNFQMIDNVAFIGSTLWTDFDNGNPMTMEYARRNMNDFEVIHIKDDNARFGSRKIVPEDLLKLHYEAKNFIFNSINLLKKMCNKIVVVSHHSPSYQSIPDQFKGNRLNGAFASQLDYDILDAEPDVWIHGHTHTSFDYYIGNTRVICNPRGYHNYQLNKKFNPLLTIEV